MRRSAFCRYRRELSNAYLFAKVGFDTAENEPSKVCRIPLRATCRSKALRGEPNQPAPGTRPAAYHENRPNEEKGFAFACRGMQKIALTGR